MKQSLFTLLVIFLSCNLSAQTFQYELPMTPLDFYSGNPAAIEGSYQMSSSLDYQSNYGLNDEFQSVLFQSDHWLNDNNNIGFLGYYSNDFYFTQIRVGLSYSRIVTNNDLKIKMGIRPLFIRNDFRNNARYKIDPLPDDYSQLQLNAGVVVKFKSVESGLSLAPYTSFANWIGQQKWIYNHGLHIFGKYHIGLYSHWKLIPLVSFHSSIGRTQYDIHDVMVGAGVEYKQKVKLIGAYEVTSIQNDHHNDFNSRYLLTIEIMLSETINLRYQYGRQLYLMTAAINPSSHMFGISFTAPKDD